MAKNGWIHNVWLKDYYSGMSREYDVLYANGKIQQKRLSCKGDCLCEVSRAKTLQASYEVLTAKYHDDKISEEERQKIKKKIDKIQKDVEDCYCSKTTVTKQELPEINPEQ